MSIVLGAAATPTASPQKIALDADPGGIFWSPHRKLLFIGDFENNRILSWTDAGGFGPVLELPEAPPNGAGVGGLVQRPDGTLLACRLGFGITGGVVRVTPDGKKDLLPNLDPARWRVGLASAADGALFVTYYVGPGKKAGAVARLAMDGTETDFITGLRKPVGVGVSAGMIYAADQDADQIVRCPVSSPWGARVFSRLERPEALAMGSKGVIFATSRRGLAYRITPDGEAKVLASGFQRPRGVAYDCIGRRLFIAEYGPHGSHNLHILPQE